jgi:SAM-dependent methyltransferase
VTSNSSTSRSARERFTFRGNVATSRHGWLRLTPAYSVHLVGELLDGADPARGPILDPFCGTGTTLFACAERGLDCTTIDLNPFLVWFANAKAGTYSVSAIRDGSRLVADMAHASEARTGDRFVPDIHRIDRWWSRSVLEGLGRAFAVLSRNRTEEPRPGWDLAAIAFCRALIEVADVSFGHQSMSFRSARGASAKHHRRGGARRVAVALEEAFGVVTETASVDPAGGRRRVLLGDSRDVPRLIGRDRFGTVITSPPYSNRMSYIRELRPYMYWLGYLVERRDAGELDWRAIGGTWGAATSRLSAWKPDPGVEVPYPGLRRIVERISRRAPVLGSYVHRYFEDMARHTQGLARVLAPGARVHYVVGNSKFYDVLLPAEEVFVALFQAAGLENARVTRLRKRTSKVELYEFLVEADAPRVLPRRGSRRREHAEGRDAPAP